MMNSKKASLIFSYFLTLTLCLGCGGNVFAPFEPPNPSLEATKALEQKDTKSAIKILLDTLGKEYSNQYRMIGSFRGTERKNILVKALETNTSPDRFRLVSILASAHSQLYDVDIFDILIGLAEQNQFGTSSANLDVTNKSALSVIMQLLPEATDSYLNGLSEAIAILQSIGSENFTQVDKFKISILFLANSALTIKSLDKNGDGTIGPEDFGQIDSELAEVVFDALDQAGVFAGQFAGVDSTTDPTKFLSGSSGEKIVEIKKEICESTGTTYEEKLENFLAQQGIDPSDLENQPIPKTQNPPGTNLQNELYHCADHSGLE